MKEGDERERQLSEARGEEAGEDNGGDSWRGGMEGTVTVTATFRPGGG